MKLIHIIKNNPFAVIAFLMAAVISVITVFKNRTVGLIELGCVLFVAVISLRWYLNDQKRKIEEVHLLTSSLKYADGEADELHSFPLPVVLIDKAGNLVWFNELFEGLLKDFSVIKENNIAELINLTNNADLLDKKECFEVDGDQFKYTVYPTCSGESHYALYFIDDTNLKYIRTQYNLTRPVVLLINVDSLEQAEDLMPHEDYYALNSDIDRLISKWFVENSCIFRKFSDGKFIAITEYKNLKNMIDSRFSIIDKVRTGHFGPAEADITLSIGVGHSREIKECEDDAREALDMARGRGGDQVALKTGDNYEFFGGISSGKEKRGKIKSRVFASALDDYISKCSNVLVMGHSFSDFDCIGAAGGICAIVRAVGKNVHVVVNKRKTMAASLIKMLESGSGAVSFISPERAMEEADENTLLIIVDTMRVKLVEEPRLLQLGLKTVIIDHHRMAVDHIEGNTYELLEPYVSSACEMVTELVQYSPSKPKLTPAQAQGLLAGIMLDTKDYTLRVGVRTFDAASYLRSCKADTVAVRKLFSGSAEENIQINNIVNAAVFFNRYAIAISGISGGNARLVCAKAADELLKIENVDASFVISAFDDQTVNISARSLERINVQLIMEQLGGGGHHSMAAAQLKDMTLQEAFELLKTKTDEYLKTIA